MPMSIAMAMVKAMTMTMMILKQILLKNSIVVIIFAIIINYGMDSFH